MNYELAIEALAIEVKLGVPEAERAVPQTVLVAIQFQFIEPPAACFSDQIEETICYATLTKRLQTFCESRTFCLLETLSYQLYQYLKTDLLSNLSKQKINISLRVTKHPPLKNLQRAYFTIQDDEWVSFPRPISEKMSMERVD
ncbi:dihydroneopterin aldolase [Rickettsiella massiliensis]|uniref:dihydroneopterin aldolase n=1 Tax=Rickettsiella massiliensis TaxID=676517 RepID=UPI00029B4D05|nr:dihydroneopterin aldolase [Rickettsiella massiliensis]